MAFKSFCPHIGAGHDATFSLPAAGRQESIMRHFMVKVGRKTGHCHTWHGQLQRHILQ